jgi:hypothetical protein
VDQGIRRVKATEARILSHATAFSIPIENIARRVVI